MTFDHTDKIAGYNVTEDRAFTRKYTICGTEAIWFAGNGVQITASVSENGESLKIKYNMGDAPAVDTFAKKPKIQLRGYLIYACNLLNLVMLVTQ